MSESLLTRRTRRKLGGGVETIHKQAVRSKIKAEPSASSRASVDIAGAPSVAPTQSEPISSDDPERIESPTTLASPQKSSMASETHTMPAKTKFSPPHITTAASDNGSSSLSDLDEIPEDQQEEDTKSSSDGESIKDNDTEAETERIDPSPRKSRQLAAEAANNTAARSQTKGPTVESTSPVITSKDQGHTNGQSTVNDKAASGDLRENGVESPRKRKRSSPLSEPDEEATQDGKPARKRSASAKLVDLLRPRENGAADDDSDVAVKEALIPDNASNRSPTEDLDDGLVDDVEPESVADADEPMELAIDQDPESARSSVEAEDGQKTPDAMDEVLPVGGTDVDEAEMAAKTEEELAKKRVAMEDLKPIEIRFAIFRDKIFDEKNNELTKIEEDLSLAEPTNLTYLRQIQAVHARCEEKIQHEDCMLRYKSEALQRVTLAERAIAHSQYAQEVREARDRHLIELNKTFCRIQRERRQWKAVEPHYTRSFNPNRAEQIANQRSYNKEVSLLSGIARHAGFPAAPELEGAASGDVESDLRRMNIRPNAQPYVAQLANSSHQQEMAGEANFLERNTWARNPPSSVPRTLYRDQSNGSPFEPVTRAPQGDIHMLERAMKESGPEVVPHPHPAQQRSRDSPFSSGNRRAFQPSPGQELPPQDPATLAVDSPTSAARRPSPLGKPERMNKKMLGSSPMNMANSTPPNASPQLTQSMRNADSRQHQQRRDRETYFAGYRPSSTMDPMQRSSRFSLPPAQPQDRPLFGPIQNGITTEPTGQR